MMQTIQQPKKNRTAGSVGRVRRGHTSKAVRDRERAERLALLDAKLKKLFPAAHIALRHKNAWELLVAVMLSAQCTDKMVNAVTHTLFKKYPTLDHYVHASPHVFECDIHSTGFYRNKAKHILAAAQLITEEYSGRVPRIMEELLKVPGVGRKTANVVLGNAYGIVEGIAVDTHVRRFALRFDLTDSGEPERIEQDLMRILPREDWLGFTYRVIEYGRQIAPARRYDTTSDPLVLLYPKAAKRFRTDQCLSRGARDKGRGAIFYPHLVFDTRDLLY